MTLPARPGGQTTCDQVYDSSVEIKHLLARSGREDLVDSFLDRYTVAEATEDYGLIINTLRSTCREVIGANDIRTLSRFAVDFKNPGIALAVRRVVALDLLKDRCRSSRPNLFKDFSRCAVVEEFKIQLIAIQAVVASFLNRIKIFGAEDAAILTQRIFDVESAVQSIGEMGLLGKYKVLLDSDFQAIELDLSMRDFDDLIDSISDYSATLARLQASILRPYAKKRD